MTLRLRPMLYGGASLAVLALALVLVRDPGLLTTAPLPPEPLAEVADPAKPVSPPPVAAPETETVLVAPSSARQERAAALVDQSVPAAPSSEAEAPPAAPMPVGRAEETMQESLAPARLSSEPAPAALPLVAPAPRAKRAAMDRPEPPADVVVSPEASRDRFEKPDPAAVKVTAQEPVSTFSIDVDTASYAWVRRAISGGSLPDPASVRIEEMVNYFPYDYPAPASREEPFATTVSLMPTPWNPDTRLMHIGIRGYALAETRPAANIVFLIDTSGSMAEPDRLPLLLNAFRLMVGALQPADRVAIVAYAGSAGTVLEPTPVSERARILDAFDRLQAGGSTAGGEGITAAYALAESMKAEGTTTRVILATDGDFNVGLADDASLKALVERKRAGGVFLSVLGFGAGNYNDDLMQTLAQNGNGQAAYIDSLSEARKVLIEGFGGAVFPIAQDVKIQVEFNPAEVAEYRLIGYETRALAREDFNDDRVDAGEIGAGHTVTALYEITPVGSPALTADPLRYQTAPAATPAPATGGELAFVKLRYKLPGGTESRLITRAVTEAAAAVTDEARFAAAVAGVGQLLTGAKYTGTWGWAEAEALARSALGPDPFGYRAEFLKLTRDAGTLATLARP